MNKFKKGDRVVPLKKSVKNNLENSNVWNRAKNAEQPYIYVMEYKVPHINSSLGMCVVCSFDGKEGGDYFKEDDLMYYDVPRNFMESGKYEVESLRRVNDELEKKCMDLEKELTRVSIEKMKMEEEIKQIETENDELGEDRDRLVQECDKKNIKIEKLEAEVLHLEDELTEANDDWDEAVQERAEARREVEFLKQENDELRRNSVARGDYDTMAEGLSELVERKETVIEGLEVEVDSMEETIQNQDEYIHRLEKSLERANKIIDRLI